MILQLALWTARRNGRALACAVGAQFQKQMQQSPELPSIQHWQGVLQERRGWSRVREFVYAFRDEERIQLKAKADPLEVLDWLATVELKPLSQGLHPKLREQTLQESVRAARAWWNLHMKKVAA